MSEVVAGGINLGNMVLMPIVEHMVVTSRAHADAFKRYLSTQWISVKERLPENDKPVLVTLKWGEDNYEISVGEYWKDGKDDNFGWGSWQEYVIAWMPLPEAYQEGEE